MRCPTAERNRVHRHHELLNGAPLHSFNARYLWYESYKSPCCTAPGCTGNITTPPSAPGAPCCWMKSAIGPAHLWSNDAYCTAAGVVSVPGPLL